MAAQGPLPDAANRYQGVYEGFIGPSRVLVAFDGETGRFTFIAGIYDRGLISAANGTDKDWLELVLPHFGDPAQPPEPFLVAAKWDLHSYEGRLTGRREELGTGRVERISLTPVAQEQIEGDDEPLPQDYARRWLFTAPHFVPKGDESSRGPLLYTLTRDDLYGNVVPRLTGGPQRNVMRIANLMLEALHRSIVWENRMCIEAERRAIVEKNPQDLSDYDHRQAEAIGHDGAVVDTTFGSLGLFTLLQSSARHCAGGSPIKMRASAYTLDLRNGDLIISSNIDFALPQSIAKRPSKTLIFAPTTNADAFAQPFIEQTLDLDDGPKRTRFDGFWVEKFRKRIAEKKVNALNDDQVQHCAKKLDADLAQSAANIEKIVYPTEKGLAILATGFENSQWSCVTHFEANPLILPYSELSVFARPGDRLLPVP